MTTTYRRTTITAILMAAAVTLTVAPSIPAAQAHRAEGATVTVRYPTAIDDIVAYRHLQAAQYLLDNGFLGLR
jgi:hypothetical protein